MTATSHCVPNIIILHLCNVKNQVQFARILDRFGRRQRSLFLRAASFNFWGGARPSEGQWWEGALSFFIREKARRASQRFVVLFFWQEPRTLKIILRGVKKVKIYIIQITGENMLFPRNGIAIRILAFCCEESIGANLLIIILLIVLVEQPAPCFAGEV